MSLDKDKQNMLKQLEALLNDPEVGDRWVAETLDLVQTREADALRVFWREVLTYADEYSRVFGKKQ